LIPLIEKEQKYAKMLHHIRERTATNRLRLAAELDELKDVLEGEQAEYEQVTLWSRKVSHAHTSHSVLLSLISSYPVFPFVCVCVCL
jgi:hypothetical protein